MARYLSFTCLVLTALVLGLFDGTHQAPYPPFINPFAFFYPRPNLHQARFNFNNNDLNSLLVRTGTATTSASTTSTVTVTCTKSTTGIVNFTFINLVLLNECFSSVRQCWSRKQSEIPLPQWHSEAQPRRVGSRWHYGVRSRRVTWTWSIFTALLFKFIRSVEPTAMPEERMPRNSESVPINPYEIFPIDSSLSRQIHPSEAGQVRFFFGTVTTITFSTTIFTTTTKTLTPGCSLAGFFSQCG